MLLFPHKEPARRFPTDKGKLDRIPLQGIAVGDPLGTDTYLLLTTSTPLAADGSALEFTGVVTREESARSVDPLEDLLDLTSAGTRSPPRPTPTNWSVQRLRTQRVPELSPTVANSKPK